MNSIAKAAMKFFMLGDFTDVPAFKQVTRAARVEWPWIFREDEFGYKELMKTAWFFCAQRRETND